MKIASKRTRGPRGPFKRVCRHCNVGSGCRSRGLCWNCFYTPGVRELYPSTSKVSRRGHGVSNGPAPLPEPTDAPPGSVEKVAVLEQRARLGETLWHPQDAPMDPESVRLGMGRHFPSPLSRTDCRPRASAGAGTRAARGGLLRELIARELAKSTRPTRGAALARACGWLYNSHFRTVVALMLAEGFVAAVEGGYWQKSRPLPG
jgi:hypothetical protein